MAAKRKSVGAGKRPSTNVGSTKKRASTERTKKRAAAKDRTSQKEASTKTAPVKKTSAKKPSPQMPPAKKLSRKVPTKPAAKAQGKKALVKELDALRVSALFSVPAERLYDAWLDATEHAAFTGGGATSSPEVGGRHTAWDGYIEGTNLELVRPNKIVQSWRTTEFPDDADESRLEILLVPEGEGTRLILHHTAIPKGQGAQYESGWEEHYFVPMKRYFGD